MKKVFFLAVLCVSAGTAYAQLISFGNRGEEGHEVTTCFIDLIAKPLNGKAIEERELLTQEAAIKGYDAVWCTCFRVDYQSALGLYLFGTDTDKEPFVYQDFVLADRIQANKFLTQTELNSEEKSKVVFFNVAPINDFSYAIMAGNAGGDKELLKSIDQARKSGVKVATNWKPLTLHKDRYFEEEPSLTREAWEESRRAAGAVYREPGKDVLSFGKSEARDYRNVGLHAAGKKKKKKN